MPRNRMTGGRDSGFGTGCLTVLTRWFPATLGQVDQHVENRPGEQVARALEMTPNARPKGAWLVIPTQGAHEIARSLASRVGPDMPDA